VRVFVRLLTFVAVVALAYGAMVALSIAVELVWPALVLSAMLFALWLILRRVS
jgi:hypothetical protein